MNPALVVTALFNGAWQGAVLCGFGNLVLRRVRRRSASTMFAVWTVLLAISVLLPIANYAFAARPYVVQVNRPAAETPKAYAAIGQRTRAHLSDTPASAVENRTFALKPQGPSWGHRSLDVLTWLLRHSSLLLSILVAVAGLRLIMLLRDLAGMFRVRRAARRIERPIDLSLSIRRPYAFATSDKLTSPCVLGFVPALIVIPSELLASQPGDLLSLVLHEAEHVRRYDDVQNVLHRFIDAVAFFCPGVHIALRELALYREQICDDAAVAGVGDPLAYAVTLTGMAQWAQGRGVPVPSFIFKRKQLVCRLEMLLDRAVNHSLGVDRRFAVSVAAAVLVVAAIVLRIQVPVVAQVLVSSKPVVATHVLPPATRAKQSAARPAGVGAVASRAHVVPADRGKHIARVADVTARPGPPAQVRKAPAAARIGAVRQGSFAALSPKIRRSAYAATVRPSAPAATVRLAPPVAHLIARSDTGGPDDLLDALQKAGLSHLSVDDLVALRDHGVTAQLVTAAHAFFGSSLNAQSLVDLADHGIGPEYLLSLSAAGLRLIGVKDAIELRDHGASPALIAAAQSYFGAGVPARSLVRLADNGIDPAYLQSLGVAGIRGISADDVVRLRDNGVDARYILRVRAYNPHASLDEIIRLRDSGF